MNWTNELFKSLLHSKVIDSYCPIFFDWNIQDIHLFDVAIKTNKNPLPAQLINTCLRIDSSWEEKIKTWSPNRKKEFIVSRLMLSAIQKDCGIENFVPLSQLYQGVNKSFCASLTHSKGLIRVGLSKNASLLGIDSELNNRVALSGKLWEKISTDRDRTLLKQRELEEDLVIRSLIFSAKESLYKYAYPKRQKYFGFQEANIIKLKQSENRGVLVLECPILKDYGLEISQINYLLQDGYVHTIAFKQ